MTSYISPQQFYESEGVEDWRLTSEGATAFFRTSSFAESARFVQAISALPGVEEHRPGVDVRQDGVTVHTITYTNDYFGPGLRDVELARQVSAAASKLGLSADPSQVQSVLIIPGATDIETVKPFWQAVLGYERAATARTRTWSTRTTAVRRSGSSGWTGRVAMAAGRSTSPSGCRTNRRRHASPRRWPRAAGWCATSSPPPGGRSPTRRGTKPTSLP